MFLRFLFLSSVSSCVVDGVVIPELNETVGDGGESDTDNIPRASDVFIDGVSSAKDRWVFEPVGNGNDNDNGNGASDCLNVVMVAGAEC